MDDTKVCAFTCNDGEFSASDAALVKRGREEIFSIIIPGGSSKHRVARKREAKQEVKLCPLQFPRSF